MLFTETPKLRALERLMTSIPNFMPQGSGYMVLHCFEPPPEPCPKRYRTYCGKGVKCKVPHCPYLEAHIIAGRASRAEVMKETMKHIRSHEFSRRLCSFLRESEDHPMHFRNEKHRLVFNEAMEKLDRKNNALVSAVYLLTADRALWAHARRHILKNGIAFGSMKPMTCSTSGYTLLCCAKDLYLGTKHITLGDLADADLVSPGTFALACSAMAVRRFGLGALGYKKDEGRK